jgi:hypothetical protein
MGVGGLTRLSGYLSSYDNLSLTFILIESVLNISANTYRPISMSYTAGLSLLLPNTFLPFLINIPIIPFFEKRTKSLSYKLLLTLEMFSLAHSLFLPTRGKWLGWVLSCPLFPLDFYYCTAFNSYSPPLRRVTTGSLAGHVLP